VSFLVDTNVISELRRRQCDPRVQAWMDEQPASELFISIITVIEIETGILRLARRDRVQATASMQTVARELSADGLTFRELGNLLGVSYQQAQKLAVR
jgi:predicted nucleic acid-binding protein